MTNAEAFIAAARAHAVAGTRFRHQGRSAHGLDCIGLIVVCAAEIGINLIDRTDYPRDPNGLLQPALTKQLIEVIERAPGDVLLMRFGTQPQHVGIYTGTSMIHAYAPYGRVVEHRIDPRWHRRIVATYRFREFAA